MPLRFPMTGYFSRHGRAWCRQQMRPTEALSGVDRAGTGAHPTGVSPEHLHTLNRI
jgi:hypothetical protein